MSKTRRAPYFIHKTTGEGAAMAVLTLKNGKCSVHMIRFGPAEDGVPGSILSDTRTICGKYTGNPPGCTVELLHEENAPDPDESAVCKECQGYGGQN